MIGWLLESLQPFFKLSTQLVQEHLQTVLSSSFDRYNLVLDGMQGKSLTLAEIDGQPDWSDDYQNYATWAAASLGALGAVLWCVGKFKRVQE